MLIPANFKTYMDGTARGFTKRLTLFDGSVIQNEFINFKRSFEGDFFRTTMHSLTFNLGGEHDLKGQTVKLEIGVREDGSTSEAPVWLNLGTFIVKEQEYSDDEDVTKITEAYDIMLKAHEEYRGEEMGLSYPVTIKAIVDRLCAVLDIELGVTTFYNQDKLVSEDKWNNRGVTYRNVLDDVAGATGSLVYIKQDKLIIEGWNKEKSYDITEGNLKKLKVGEKYGAVNMLNLTREPMHDNVIRPVGWTDIPKDERVELVIADNEIMTKNREDYIDGLLTHVTGLDYTPFEVDSFGYGYIHFGDKVNIIDKDGTVYSSYILNGIMTVTSGISEKLGAEKTDFAKQDYALVTDELRQDYEIWSIVDKQNGVIEQVISSVETVREDLENIELTPGEPGAPGKDGKDGNGIVSTEIRYQKSTSGTSTPSGQWQTFIPIVQDNEYLWTRTTINYKSGEPSVAYSIGKMGAQGSKGEPGEPGVPGEPGEAGTDGRGIVSTVIEYKNSTSGTTVPGGTWSTTIPAVGADQYLWTRTTINYTTGDPSVAYSVGKMGKDGVKGDRGEPGKDGAKGQPGTSVESITEFYGLSKTTSQKPTSWTEIISEATPLPVMTATNKYLWNYEKINFSDSTSQNTVPVIVGAYGDKGDTGTPGQAGADGRSISSIQDKYLVSSLASGVTRSTSGWKDKPDPTTDTLKYLWNYEIITWNKAPTTTYVEPIIIGVHGSKGDKGDKGATGVPGAPGKDGATTYNWVAYADSATGTGITGNPTGKAYVGYAFGKTSKTPIYSVSEFETPFQLVKGADGVDGEEGRQGIPGEPGKNGRDNYTWVKYADTPTTGMSDNPTGKKYIGFAYNKTTGTESTDYSLYEWNLAPNYFDEELTGIKTTVTTHTTAIRENKDNIELSATKEEVETIETNFNDIITESTERINENSSQIEVNTDAITNEVIARETLDGNLREEINSKVQQTAEDFTVIFNKIEADQTLTSEELAVVTSHFRVNENGVIIGNSESAIEFFAENNRVGFRENGEDIAYWEEGTMNVDNLIAIVTVIIGYHQIEKYDSPTQGKTTIVRMGQ